MKTPHSIALCVDDFGIDESVQRAVLALADLGRVNGVGCMVGGRAWPQGRAALDQLHASGVDVGLHLDLTDHVRDPALRRPLPRLVVDTHLGRLPVQALRDEVRGQLDRFEQSLGRAPDYIDGHRHVHQLPQVRDALLEALAGRTARPWLRSTRRAPGLQAPADSTWAERRKPRLIEALGAHALERAAQQRHLHTNRHLLGVYGFAGDEARYRRWLEAWLAAAGDGDVLMCHPARGDTDRAAGDEIATARAVECRVLCSPWLGQALARHGVTPARLGRLMRSVQAQAA